MDILWLNIGKELAKVPTHVAQEYCSDIPFAPLSNFKSTLSSSALKRTIKLYDHEVRMEPWFLLGAANPNLGVLFSICKVLRGWPLHHWLLQTVMTPRNRGGRLWWVDDFLAITALCEMRTVNDREQTLENLKPLAPEADFRF